MLSIVCPNGYKLNNFQFSAIAQQLISKQYSGYYTYDQIKSIRKAFIY
jgi:hypothetical protein